PGEDQVPELDRRLLAEDERFFANREIGRPRESQAASSRSRGECEARGLLIRIGTAAFARRRTTARSGLPFRRALPLGRRAARRGRGDRFDLLLGGARQLRDEEVDRPSLSVVAGPERSEQAREPLAIAVSKAGIERTA